MREGQFCIGKPCMRKQTKLLPAFSTPISSIIDSDIKRKTLWTEQMFPKNNSFDIWFYFRFWRNFIHNHIHFTEYGPTWLENPIFGTCKAKILMILSFWSLGNHGVSPWLCRNCKVPRSLWRSGIIVRKLNFPFTAEISRARSFFVCTSRDIERFFIGK